MDKEKLKEWAKIATLLSDKATYQDLLLGIESKKRYLNVYLKELKNGTTKHILDIGAGTGTFCYVCQGLGHTTLANLPCSSLGKKSHTGYRKACEFFDVPVFDFTYGNGPADLGDETFDVVNTQGMIGDLPDESWHPTLDDMLRVLKPGGILLLCPGHVSGVRNTSLVNEWAKSAPVKLIEYWEEKTTWKWKKLAS